MSQSWLDHHRLQHLGEQLEKLRKQAASAGGVVVKLSSGSLGRNASKLYPLFGAYEIESALLETKVHISRDASKRRDERAQLLHNSGYQGGGDIVNQLVHYRKVSAERDEKVAEKKGEIQMLRQEMELKDLAGGSQEAITGSKRNFKR